MALRQEEESWREVFVRLQERYPTVGADRVLQALRNHDGHAGNAAAELRDLTSAVVKPPDPDDAEHVATLLSSPAMFKHACKEQFKKFDINGDGVLEWSEILQLTHDLYFNFGLAQPSEGSIHAFFVATDENNDGVLNEKEFRKFFEMFLRYSFFDVVKLRQIVEEGQQKHVSLTGSEELPRIINPARVASDAEAAKVVARAKSPMPDERRRTSSHGEQRREEPRPDVGAPRRSAEPAMDRRASGVENESKGDSRSNAAHTGGMVFRCVAPNGVTVRNSPEFSDRSNLMVQAGEKVPVIEHWIRTPQGWLPVMDGRGNVLFDRYKSRDNQGYGEKHDRHPPAAERNGVSPSGERHHRRGSNSKQQQGGGGGRGPELAPSGGGGSTLAVGEQDWKDRFDRLQERFPQATAEQVLGILREVEGHAGKAAALLRELDG